LLAWLDKIFSIVELIIPTTLDFYAGISKTGPRLVEGLEYTKFVGTQGASTLQDDSCPIVIV
jgi:hypothetical protein